IHKVAFLFYPFFEIRQNFQPRDRQSKKRSRVPIRSPDRRGNHIVGMVWGELFILAKAFGDASKKINQMSPTILYLF
ncbi:MAG: hypothetical protein IJ724_07925, partial [Muribaculaceae bacterium]|nr:hypothetical protein [Muribaculaceae bacterium]